MKRNVQMVAHTQMQRIQKEYAATMSTENTCFSLLELFNHEGFRLEEFCRSFKPHPFASSLAKASRSFGREYDIWLDNAEHYITCAIFLFPTAPIDRMLPIVKNLAIDYYLNDTMGREVFNKLSAAAQHKASRLIDRMGNEQLVLQDTPGMELIEIANREVLEQMRNNAPQDWFNRFLQLYCHHIKVTHRDCNAGTNGHILSVAEYTDCRCHMAGMHHVISLIEYSEGKFMDQQWLAEKGLCDTLERLQYVTAAIGGLMNDLFSFEKEVIDNMATSNLVMILALNEPQLTLTEVLMEACGIVRDLLREFVILHKKIRMACLEEVDSNPEMAQYLHKHLDGLECCVQASWIWQVRTLRYKRLNSIWLETQMPEVMRAAV